MRPEIDFTNVKTSWTKYDIVQVMEVIHDVETIENFKNKKAIIDEPILRSFLGIKSLKEPTPQYWVDIQDYPKEKKLFALFATLFTHGEIVNEFATKYTHRNMKGVFELDRGKQYTNIRSALIESGAAQPIYRRTTNVPFDFSPIFQNGEVGKLFKLVLTERISRIFKGELTDKIFYEICHENGFHSALGVSFNQFKSWLAGISVFKRLPSKKVDGRFIKEVRISNFFSVEDAVISIQTAKEIYLLGENGDGKSLILMGTYLAFNGNFVTEKTEQEKTGKVGDILRKYNSIILAGIDDKGNEYNPKKNLHLDNLFAYGTHRGRTSTDNAEEYGFMSLFDSEQTLINPISWLKNQKLLELEKSFDLSNSVGEIKQLPNSFSVAFLEKMFFDLLEKNVEIKVEGGEVTFVEKGTTLTFDQLSEGYKSVIIFICDLIYRLNKNAVENQELSSFKGTVLVDEIDLHLHPKWQRVIVSKLRTLFPNVQFMFTTHSPTMIQGASEDAVIYRVYRNKEDGKTRITDPYFRKDLDHLMINTILTSPLFGLNDSRMNSEDDSADTSETYLLYRINELLKEKLAEQKTQGKEFIGDKAIDDLIRKIINEEVKKDDQN